MDDPLLQKLAAALFALAVLHTFGAALFERLAHRHPRHAGLLHLLGEVEVVFGLWAIVLVATMALLADAKTAIGYAESRTFTEPLFVFVVMVVAASKPVLQTVMAAVAWAARGSAPLRAWLGLAAVPLMGSLITEPAAMTIAALMLAPQVFNDRVPERLKYLAIGVLFVNVSIGGTLTSYAAPPVLMVAATWQWDSAFMLAQFGWKAALAVVINASVATLLLRPHLAATADEPERVPLAVAAVHIAFLAMIVVLAHHPVAFLGLFLLFLGFTQAYPKHQSPLILREALLVEIGRAHV